MREGHGVEVREQGAGVTRFVCQEGRRATWIRSAIHGRKFCEARVADEDGEEVTVLVRGGTKVEVKS